MITLVDHDTETMRLSFYKTRLDGTKNDTSYNFVLFEMHDNVGGLSLITMEALRGTLGTDYFESPHSKHPNNGYFMIFKLLNDSNIIVGGVPIKSANGRIYTQLRDIPNHALDHYCNVSFRILDDETLRSSSLFCKKDITKRPNDTINIFVANPFVRNLLTCERDIIARFGMGTISASPEVELYISNERRQDLINEIGIILARLVLN